MLWAILLVLLIAWLLGLAGTYQSGGFLWLLLVAAFVVLIVQVVTEGRSVR